MFRRVTVLLFMSMLAFGPAVPVYPETLLAQGSDATLPLFKALAEGFEKETGHVFQITGGGGISRGKRLSFRSRADRFSSQSLK